MTSRIHRSEPDQALLRSHTSTWQRDRARGPLRPMYPPYRGIAWELAREWRQVVSVLVVGLLFFGSLLFLL